MYTVRAVLKSQEKFIFNQSLLLIQNEVKNEGKPPKLLILRLTIL
jgi:hypothetical protein